MLNPEYHGKGYAYESAHAFFDYLFKEKGARRIYAYTEDYNVPSQKLCGKTRHAPRGAVYGVRELCKG